MAALSKNTTFLADFGGMIVAWNKVEYWGRQMVHWQCGGQSNVLTAEMSSVSLRDAISAYAHLVSISNAEISAHLDHFSSYFDRLREYRNYYAHGLFEVFPPMGPREANGFVTKTVSRGKLAFDSAIITSKELNFVSNHCVTLANYASGIQCAFIHPGGGRDAALRVWPSWPEKPPLPDKLTKNRDVAQPHPPQP